MLRQAFTSCHLIPRKPFPSCCGVPADPNPGLCLCRSRKIQIRNIPPHLQWEVRSGRSEKHPVHLLFYQSCRAARAVLLERVVCTWATLPYRPSNPRREVERELGSISCLLVGPGAVGQLCAVGQRHISSWVMLALWRVSVGEAGSSPACCLPVWQPLLPASAALFAALSPRCWMAC